MWEKKNCFHTWMQFELFASWTPLLDINCQDLAFLQAVVSIMADCDSVCVSSCNLIYFLCKWCQTHLSAPCSNLHRPWKEKEQKIFQHILVHALLATAPTSLSTWSWVVRLPLSDLPVFATCLHQSLAITWHCLYCSSLGNKCTFFMFFWAKTQLERNKSVTSSFKPLMLSLTELSVCVFTSFFWTRKFPRECVSVWVLFGINLFSRERSEEDVL